jgi:hypothetical protein
MTKEEDMREAFVQAVAEDIMKLIEARKPKKPTKSEIMEVLKRAQLRAVLKSDRGREVLSAIPPRGKKQ